MNWALTFFQKNRFLSRVFFTFGVFGAVIILYGTFFDNTSDDVELSLLSSGLSQDVITQSLRRNTDKDSSKRFLDFPQKTSILNQVYPGEEDWRGVSVHAGGESYFYPFDTISPYEVINDTIAGQPILIAYCTNCETAVIADRVIDGQELFFEATDTLWEDSLIMVARGDEPRFWQQASGKELTTFDPANLVFLPFDITSFAQYRAKYPTGKLMINP